MHHSGSLAVTQAAGQAASVAAACGPSCFMARGILVPRPGIELASPALQGGFLTSGPPEKFFYLLLNLIKLKSVSNIDFEPIV